ncbi:MAG: cysteine synthase A [Spirochaetaceae bacterium]|jgi:cysteine synthase A|nr:cysteine synthase A [Spirochaetaceae bacterium]
MSDIKQNICELIGNTPLMELSRIEKKFSRGARILAKLEFFNPAGSVKDRIAGAMLEDAESKGLIGESTVIIEPTSGNTGLGLAAVCAFKGLRLIIVAPESASKAHIGLLKAYGAEVVLTDSAKGVRESIRRAEELAADIKDSFIPGQFVNGANPAAHFAATGPEIWQQTGGVIDYFIAGVGTGGTISGAGSFLKSLKSELKIIAVEPDASPFLSEGKSGAHHIQGIGAGFAPAVLNTHIYGEVIRVTDNDAFETSRLLAKAEGLLAGPSSGAALFAAIQTASRAEAQGKTIVTIFPDSGERYISSGLL